MQHSKQLLVRYDIQGYNSFIFLRSKAKKLKKRTHFVQFLWILVKHRTCWRHVTSIEIQWKSTATAQAILSVKTMPWVLFRMASEGPRFRCFWKEANEKPRYDSATSRIRKQRVAIKKRMQRESSAYHLNKPRSKRVICCRGKQLAHFTMRSNMTQTPLTKLSPQHCHTYKRMLFLWYKRHFPSLLATTHNADCDVYYYLWNVVIHHGLPKWLCF